MSNSTQPTFTNVSQFDQSPLLAEPPPPAPPAPDDQWRTVSGTIALLATFALGIVLNCTCGRNIGQSACAWRVSFSPHSRAFRIWVIIYAWMVFSITVQMVNGFGPITYAAAPWTNYLLALSWLLCGLWVIAFSRVEPRRLGIVFAAFILASAALSATSAVGIEASWRSVHDPWRVFAVGIPYSLFAGWLCVACVINIAIAFKSFQYAPDYICYTERSAYTTTWKAEAVDGQSWVSAVPLSTAVLISVYAFLVPDPILPLPAAWGMNRSPRTHTPTHTHLHPHPHAPLRPIPWIYTFLSLCSLCVLSTRFVPPSRAGIANMKGHLKNWMAIELLLVTSVACGVSSALGVWVWR